jgi:hypothetical protein
MKHDPEVVSAWRRWNRTVSEEKRLRGGLLIDAEARKCSRLVSAYLRAVNHKHPFPGRHQEVVEVEDANANASGWESFPRKMDWPRCILSETYVRSFIEIARLLGLHEEHRKPPTRLHDEIKEITSQTYANVPNFGPFLEEAVKDAELDLIAYLKGLDAVGNTTHKRSGSLPKKGIWNTAAHWVVKICHYDDETARQKLILSPRKFGTIAQKRVELLKGGIETMTPAGITDLVDKIMDEAVAAKRQRLKKVQRLLTRRYPQASSQSPGRAKT